MAKKKQKRTPGDTSTAVAPVGSKSCASRCRFCFNKSKTDPSISFTFTCCKPNVSHKAETCRLKCNVHGSCPKVPNKRKRGSDTVVLPIASPPGPTTPTPIAPPLLSNGATPITTPTPIVPPTTANATQPTPTPTAPTPAPIAVCPFCSSSYVASLATICTTTTTAQKTNQRGGDVVCPECAQRNYCIRGIKLCLCSDLLAAKYCPIQSHKIISERQDVLILPKYVINGICYPCRLNQTKAASEYRIREKVNQNKLTSDQQMAHLLLDFKHVAIDPYPTQASTTCDEVRDQVLYDIYNFAIRTVHRSNRHGKRGSFRVLRNNKKQMVSLAVEAKRYNVYGRTNTKENGAHQFLRLYSYLTLPSIHRKILKCTTVQTDGSASIDWNELRSAKVHP